MSYVIIIFLRGFGRLTCSGIDALPSFPGASTISSSSRSVVDGVFRQSGVVHSFKVVILCLSNNNLSDNFEELHPRLLSEYNERINEYIIYGAVMIGRKNKQTLY